jgi:predicted acyltransferase
VLVLIAVLLNRSYGIPWATLFVAEVAMLFVIAVVFANKWTRFFDVFGKNPLFIFVLSGVFPRLMGLIRIPNGVNAEGQPKYLSPLSWFYEYICKPVSSNLNNGSLLYAICMIMFMWLIVYWMDKKRIYVKV